METPSNQHLPSNDPVTKALALARDIIRLESETASLREELANVIAGAKPKPAPAGLSDIQTKMCAFLASRPDASCRTAEITAATGCTDAVANYHLAALVKKQVVRRIRRGHYQLRKA